MDGETEIGNSYMGFCCMLKHCKLKNCFKHLHSTKFLSEYSFMANCQDYSQGNTVARTLEIIPRVIIYKHRLRIKQTYAQTLNIKNNSMYARGLKYSTDSPLDTTIYIEKSKQVENLPSDESIQVNITIRPQDKIDINRTRYIYITSEHPNIIFEVPIIVVADQNDFPSIPRVIKFSPTVPKTKTFYEFPIYNPTSAEISVYLKCSNPNIQYVLKSDRIPKKDFVTVLLTLNVKYMNAIVDVLKMKFSRKNFVDVVIQHEPIARSVYLSTQHLSFEELKFEKTSQKEFTACNESQDPLQFTLKYLTDMDEINENELLKNIVDPNDITEVPSQTNSADGSFEKETSEQVLTKQKSKICVQDVIQDNSFRHFGINTNGGQMKPNSSNKFTAVFHPIMDDDCNFDDDADGPFLVSTILSFEIRNELETVQKSMFVSGLISGPEVRLTPQTIDLKKLFLGEEYCKQITALNIDGQVNASVYFKDSTAKNVVVCVVTPVEGFHLEPCQKGVFLLTMFTKTIGRFTTQLKFKVKNGNHFIVTVRGFTKQVRPKAYPDIIEMGSVPVAVPQKRQVLLMNPLSVPMTLNITPAEDGEEPPLTLNITHTSDYLPVTVRNPVKAMRSVYDEYDDLYESPIELTDRSESQSTFYSLCDQSSDSSYSTRFEEEVLDPIPELARNVVKSIRNKKFFEKSEVEKRILVETLHELTDLKYFEDFQYTNYKFMDWNTIPSDPREIYVDSEPVHLSSNTGKAITVVIIPNRVGYFNRTLNIRCRPYNPVTEEDKNATLVHSKLMTSKLFVEYNCRVPNVVWDEMTDFGSRTIYAYQAYPFEICFENMTNVGGFAYFDVVPRCDDGEMFFIDNTWKHFIPANNYVYSYCAAIFRKLGDVQLCGILKFLGDNVGKPFYIKAHVLPLRVSYSVKAISRRQNVLQWTRTYIYIENVTPTRTWLTLSLKCEEYQSIEPEGCILAPTGQGVCIILHTKYYDPEFYKNTLYVNVKGGYVTEIPIMFNIEGMPIIFDPNIKDGLNIGIILANTEENYDADLPNFTKDIKVVNGGYRCYRLKIQKLKTGNMKCGKMESRTRLTITPNAFLMAPKSEDLIRLTANACDEAEIQNEFLIQIVDQTNKQRFQNVRCVITARFVSPELTWSKKEISMSYYRTHKFKEHTKMELVKLINSTEVDVENVVLKVTGPFKIRELLEHHFKKELTFAISAVEKKEVTVFLNKAAITNKFCTHVDGRIFCMANGKNQRSLSLRVNIFNPQLRITQPEIVIFTQNSEEMTEVEIENIGCLDAAYKWKKISETTNFVSENDYPVDFAKEILSDIFQMLELSDDDESDFETLSDRPNLTLLYQKRRCKLLKRKPSDEIGVVDIIYEIIDNLDLEHKRYMMRLAQDDLDSCSAADSCVEKTIDRLLGSLKLEDSYEISDVSSDDCEREQTIYFYQKSGTLEPKKKEQCLVHLPAVRKGYEKDAIFELGVVGGTTSIMRIILVNLEKTVELSHDNIYLGMKPWYETYTTKVRFWNVTQYTINNCLEEKPSEKALKRKPNRIVDGHVEIIKDKCFNLDPLGSKPVTFSGILGFSEEFVCDIKDVINDSEEKFIRLRGQGIMPIFSVTSPLSRIEQTSSEVELEYKLLQRIYYFDVFKGITVEDEERSVRAEEGPGEIQDHHSDDISLISLFEHSSSTRSSREAARNLKFFRLLQTYVMVNNNEELPNATVLEQLLETEKFLQRLSIDDHKCSLLQMVYQSYVKEQKSVDPKIPLNLKHFMVQPIPFEMHGYTLEMKSLKRNQYRKFEMELQFFGPGRLIVAARTAVKIQGLTVDFKIKESPCNDCDYIYYCAEENKGDFFDKPYRNMYERALDLENDPKLKRAHSFDVDEERNQHKRMVTNKERKAIMNYYNSLNKSVYADRKRHCILCKLYSKSTENTSGTRLRVVILFKPTKQYYQEDQLVHDYLYIDLHMGPTLPILLQGIVNI